MASEKTPNLGLNQIDRTSPKTTYFDLEKYLDQNWRAVDDFAGDVNDGVNEIKKRLDTTERKTVTLEPGVQIVHAEKAAPFSLTGLSGRMLVNLLGRVGSGDQIGSLLGWEADLAVDTSNKAQGMGSIKVTAKNATGVYNVYSSGLKLTGGRYYIALADVKNINASNNIYVNFSTGGNKALKQSIDKSQFVTIYTKCAPANDTAINLEVSSISTASGQAFYADAIRLYEVSASEYAALDSMAAEQVAAKYPYVDSVMPVRNPYAIRYGENLLPSFYEWSVTTGVKTVLDSYAATFTRSGAGQNMYVDVNCAEGKAYTLTTVSDVQASMEVQFRRIDGSIFSNSVTSDSNLLTFTPPIGAVMARIIFLTYQGANGTVKFSNPMLNIGNTAKPFKPREDSMLALQTDLYADPVTGANADTVFERDGQYFKSKKWQGQALDGSLSWSYTATSVGYKRVVLSDVNNVAEGTYNNGRMTDMGRIVKYDGKLLVGDIAVSGGDSYVFEDQGNPTKRLYITIPVADSGWADGYQPNQDDIKAYFFGYKAYDANTITPANAQAMTTATWSGTGTKYWVQRVGAANFTQSVPQTSYAGYTPYQLVYQLATPTVEPIVSEGQLTFTEGDNQVEVGTGIVLREAAKPLPYPSESGRWMINYVGLAGYTNPLKNMPSKILKVYGNGFSESFRWGTTGVGGGWYGNVYIDYLYTYSPEKSYSVTYLMLEPSPAVPFPGSYAANEKTLLADLVESVQQANTRLSVVENKKADKDSPAWISPTLLNGWTTSRPVGIMKDSNGFVHIRGLIANGLTNGGLALFTLPQGYRPISIQGPVSYGYGPSGPVFVPFDIFPDGRVCFGGGGAKDSTTVSVLFPPFIAEQ
ncbi:hypothetical protein [Paenibacillus polymyxa]|uniref:Tail fiber protein n=1 Tax=Paenibacillus polymyxa TaxID=1406 RepID=A0AAE9IEB9_PAEPO|nr:hypothetical protein [Paenibacillus polymyxa]URJ48474.1 hypothetical protein MF626_002713 [Paenibacillus polymyxa]